MNSALLADPASSNEMPPDNPPAGGIPPHVRKHLIAGTSALGLGVFIERGMGFAGNILAARLGGASTFGAYSLAITTANSISTYAGGGIGATAARFSGKYPYGTAGYSTLARVLLVVSLVSAGLAAGCLWLGAGPIAHLMGKDSLTGLLHWAVLSAVGIILLECARGFFVGQRRLAALVLLSVIVGVGMVSLLPLAAMRHSPIRMILSQGAITTTAVIVCLLLARPLGLFAPAGSPPPLPIRALLREVWSFGFVQLAGLVGVNLAGWWLTTLLARADTTLVQMGFFAIASQLRNIVGLAPNLLTEGSYAMMADPEGSKSQTPHNVMALCVFGSTFVSVLLASVGIIVVPWALTLVYGHTYSGAGITVAIALCVAVVHMGNAPAAARLTIVSIRSTGIINTIWAIFVALAATVFLLHGGSARRAMTIYLAGHLLSAALVLFVLARKDWIPPGMAKVVLLGTSTSVALAILAIARDRHPALSLALTGAMAALFAVSISLLLLIGRRHHWLPALSVFRRILQRILPRGERSSA